MSKQFRPRSNATSLTDDELILLDCLYNTSAPWRVLGRDYFAQEWNFDSHNLDDKDLLETLKRLVANGLLEVSREDKVDWYCLTILGGQEWEAERTPPWECYARTGAHTPTHGVSCLTLEAIDPDIRDYLWDSLRQVGMYTYAGGPIEWNTEYNVPLSRWKTFPIMYTLVAPITSAWGSMCVDWKEYERLRTWWRTINELKSLWGRPL